MIRESLKNLGTAELQQELIGITIGGTKDRINSRRRALLFATYVQRAFPDATVLGVKPTDTAAALNSVSGIINLRLSDGKKQEVFGKVHIESNTGTLNPLGAASEYANAEMLAKAGWPVLQAISMSKIPDYPLLLYPVIKEPPLFDKLESSHKTGIPQLTEADIKNIDQYNKQIGEKESAGLRIGTTNEAINAPVQNLLLKRLEVGGRIDLWYTPNVRFQLPGLKDLTEWGEILDMEWVINGNKYNGTVRQIIENGRRLLAFRGEEGAFMTISHGDDHSGNVRLTTPAVVFDPAFAGWNPASLDIKALAHTGFLPMAGMYYAPKGLECNYARQGNNMVVETNMAELPTYETHEVLARQIIDSRVLPILEAIKKQGGKLETERERIQSGLATCALLTINIAQLLEKGDGRAVGLLPIAVMFAEMKGLPMLSYLDKQIDRILKE